jgi:TnpA family transposase
MTGTFARKATPPLTPSSSTPKGTCLSKLWRDETTSSSDGQYFPAGGHAEAIGNLNARCGPNPGAKFSRFTSDQYGAFYIIAMNANASEAIYVLIYALDGLLYHHQRIASADPGRSVFTPDALSSK